VVLFEALSGAVPFDGETPLEVIAAVLASDVPSLEGRAPAAVLSVIHEALSKRAADRPPDAEAMCLELTAVRSSIAPAEASPRPARKPTPTRLKTSGISRGQATEFAADDLDALVSTVRAEASPATNFHVELDSPGPAEAPPAPTDFDLDFGAPVAAPQAHATPGAALPACLASCSVAAWAEDWAGGTATWAAEGTYALYSGGGDGALEAVAGGHNTRRLLRCGSRGSQAWWAGEQSNYPLARQVPLRRGSERLDVLPALTKLH
jgi:hypothetical protein